MAVQNKTIIKKMKDELQHAEIEVENVHVMKRHIAKIQLLCDLLLDDDTKQEQQPNTGTMTEQEMKAMLGAKTKMKQANNEKMIRSIQTSDEDASNGDSIFDF